MLGLLLMAIGTGGIKPCVVALGGEQFVVPAQEKQLRQFFSIFVFAVSIGSMASTILTPILRRDVYCFGDETCYPLAFGVPGALMIVAVG
jgi:solute carrier family 15 oligopeptide transporter 1